MSWDGKRLVDVVWDNWVLAKQKVEEVMYEGYPRGSEAMCKGIEAKNRKRIFRNLQSSLLWLGVKWEQCQNGS